MKIARNERLSYDRKLIAKSGLNIGIIFILILLSSCKNYETENAKLNADVTRLTSELESKNELITSLNEVIKAKDLIIEAKNSEVETANNEMEAVKQKIVEKKPEPLPIQNSINSETAIAWLKMYLNDKFLNCIDEVIFLNYTARKLINGDFNIYVTFKGTEAYNSEKKTFMYILKIYGGGTSYNVTQNVYPQDICR